MPTLPTMEEAPFKIPFRAVRCPGGCHVRLPGRCAVNIPVTATFVFTDLVDSTATAARLGPEAAEELRQTHFRLLRGAVSGSGGTEVKNLGDGLMVIYSSPSRALSGAVQMQQAVEHHNRTGTRPLAVRIGLTTGEAVEEDGDYFGDAVVVAARLCAAASGGQILAAQVVRLMVGAHAAQTFVDVGPLTLKGLPEAVDAVEVAWEPATVAGSVPLPRRLVGAASDALFGFFGRTRELGVMQDAAKLAHTSQRCQVQFVAGEAGMGKTALAAQFARAVHAEGSVVLFGHAEEDLGIAYQPWAEALSTLVRDGDPAAVGGLRPAQRGALARLVPDLPVETERIGDQDTQRQLMLEAAVELLAASSQAAPVLLVLDDLHWADIASLQLLRHVIESSTPMDLTIVCTYRDTDLGRGDPLTKLLADLHREANVTRLPLAGLDDVEIVELLAAAAGHDMDDVGVGLAHALRRETDGNPFFTAEILRHLGESGAIVLGDDGRWTIAGELDALALPGSVRDVVGRRVERLGDEAVRVLSQAAVIGREFDVDTLAELTGVNEDPLLDLLDAAVSAAVLSEAGGPGRYRFAHALIQHSLYEELSPTRRQRTHQRIAELLESKAGNRDAAALAELARHWVVATRPVDLDKALNYVRLAGDGARDALAPDDAIRWYQQALELLDRQTAPDLRLRAELLVELGTMQRLAGNADFRQSLLNAAEIAEQIDAPDVLARAALGFPGGMTMFGDEDGRRVATTALERVGPSPTATRARLLASAAGAHDATLEWRARRHFAVQAIDTARVIADEATFVSVMADVHATLSTPDRRTEAIADVELAVMMADRIGDPVLRVHTRHDLLWSCYQRCDVAAADRVAEEMEGITQRFEVPRMRWETGMARAGRMLLAGRPADAEAANERAMQAGTAAGQPDALGVFGAVLMDIRWHQGRLAEIADFFIDVARDNPSIAALRAGVPAMLCELGRIDEARERLAVEEAAGFAFPLDNSWLNGMHDFLDALASTGMRDGAATVAERVAPYASQVASPAPVVVHGAIARPLARAATVLGDFDQAEQWFAIAHDVHAQLRAPFWTARGQLDHADLCLARQANGDLERARAFVTTASAAADTYGYAGLARRADALLGGR